MRLRSGFWTAGLLAATAVLLIGLTSPEATPEVPNFDEPDAAARRDLNRRRPSDADADIPALYDIAEARVARFSRFSSAIDRVLPASYPQTRLWLAGNRVIDATARANP